MKKDDERIKKLTEENAKLRRELDSLKRELEKANGTAPLFSSKDKYAEEFEKQSRNETLYSRKSYTAFLLSHISNTSVFHVYKRIIAFLRKYALVSTTLKIAAIILAILQTSTVFVLATSVFVVSLPFTFLVGYAALILSLFGRRRLKKKIADISEGKDIFILTPPRGRAFEKSSFFNGMAEDIAKDKTKLVIIVSPYFLSSKGVGKSRKLFSMARIESDNVIIVRRHYYFSLKRKKKPDTHKNITILY